MATETDPKAITPAPPRRRLARFSLGTLLLITLLIGDAATIWWRWDPWVLKKSLVEKPQGAGRSYYPLHGDREQSRFSPDGTLFLRRVNGHDEPQCFNTESGMELDLPEGVSHFTADLHWAFVNLDKENKVALYNLSTKELNRLDIPFEKEPESCFSPDNRLLAMATEADTIKLWDIESLREITTTAELPGGVSEFGFSPDSKRMYALGMDGNLRIWDAQSGRLAGELKDRRYSIYAVVLSPDSHSILASCSDARARLFSLPELKFEAALDFLEDYLHTAAFSPDSALIVTSAWNGDVRIWNRAGRLRKELKSSGIRMNALAFSPDATRILGGGSDAAARIWDTMGRQIVYLAGQPEPHVFARTESIDPVMRGKESDLKRASAEESSMETPQPPSEQAWRDGGTAQTGHSEQIEEVRFMNGGSIIMTRDFDGSVRLWDASTGLAPGPGIQSNFLAVTRDGRQVALMDSDNILQIWECHRSPTDSRFVGQPEIIFGGILLILLVFNFRRSLRKARI